MMPHALQKPCFLGQGQSGQTQPGLEMLEKAKVRPEEGAGKDAVEDK